MHCEHAGAHHWWAACCCTCSASLQALCWQQSDAQTPRPRCRYCATRPRHPLCRTVPQSRRSQRWASAEACAHCRASPPSRTPSPGRTSRPSAPPPPASASSSNCSKAPNRLVRSLKQVHWRVDIVCCQLHSDSVILLVLAGIAPQVNPTSELYNDEAFRTRHLLFDLTSKATTDPSGNPYAFKPHCSFQGYLSDTQSGLM